MVEHSSDGYKEFYPDGTVKKIAFTLTDDDLKYFRSCRRLVGDADEVAAYENQTTNTTLTSLMGAYRELEETPVWYGQFKSISFTPRFLSVPPLELKGPLPEKWEEWRRKKPEQVANWEKTRELLQIATTPFHKGISMILGWSSDSGDKGNRKCFRYDYTTRFDKKKSEINGGKIIYTVFYADGGSFGDDLYEIRLAKVGSERVLKEKYLKSYPLPNGRISHVDEVPIRIDSGKQSSYLILY